jgi:hypothetical protein
LQKDPWIEPHHWLLQMVQGKQRNVKKIEGSFCRFPSSNGAAFPSTISKGRKHLAPSVTQNVSICFSANQSGLSPGNVKEQRSLTGRGIVIGVVNRSMGFGCVIDRDAGWTLRRIRILVVSAFRLCCQKKVVREQTSIIDHRTTCNRGALKTSVGLGGWEKLSLILWVSSVPPLTFLNGYFPQ